jgi:hypothetical protein
MKKTVGTIVAAAAVVLLTATFGFAEYAAAERPISVFPVGLPDCGRTDSGQPEEEINRMYTAEVVGAFALYTV